jgi:hypothetical protein
MDVTARARDAGFIFPVAVTSAVFHEVLEPPEGTEGSQDVGGRTWDMLTILRRAIRQTAGGRHAPFAPLFVMRSGSGATPVPLKAICGPGDEAEPVITILLLHED